MYRAVWIVTAASDDDVRRFSEKDEIRLTMSQMAEAADKACGVNFFVDFKKRAWDAMNSYTHTGLLQLGRRFTGHQLKAAYSAAEIEEVISTATAAILMLIRPFFVDGLQGDAEKLDQLGADFSK